MCNRARAMAMNGAEVALAPRFYSSLLEQLKSSHYFAPRVSLEQTIVPATFPPATTL